MKIFFNISLATIILSSCGMQKLTPSGISTVKINTNINPIEINDNNKITVKNLKGESRVFTTQTFNYNSFDDYNFTKNQLSKKRRTLIVSHPYYNPDTVVIRRKLRPVVFSLDVLGAITFYLSPSLIIDLANGNMWKVKKSDKNISLNFSLSNSYYELKLKDIDSNIFSKETDIKKGFTLFDSKKEILNKNLNWDGTDNLYCYYSGEKIVIPPFNSSIEKRMRSSRIYVLFEWYPNKNHRFFGYSTLSDMDIADVLVYRDSLGRACYSYANDTQFPGKPITGPLTLLKFASLENAKKWLSGEKNSEKNSLQELVLSKKLENYLNDFPQTPYLDLVMTKIYKYEYKIARTENTLDSYKKYISRFPNSPYNLEINDNITKLEKILSSNNLTLNDYEYVITHNIGASFIKKIEKDYLNIFFTEGIKKQKNLKELNNLEFEMRQLEKLTGSFYSNESKTKVLDFKKKYFEEYLKKGKSINSFLSEEMRTSPYSTYNYPNVFEKNKFDSIIDYSNTELGYFLDQNNYLNGTYEINNETYNIKNGLLNGKYKKVDSLGRILRIGNFEADFKNNISKPIGEHIFCYEYYENKEYSRKEKLVFDNNGRITSYQEFDQEENDLTLKRFNELINEGDNCLKNEKFKCAIENYDKVKYCEFGYNTRFGYIYDYALPELINTLPKQVDRVPLKYDKTIYDAKIKLTKEKQKQNFIDIANKNFNSGDWYLAYTNYNNALEINKLGFKEPSIESKRDLAKSNYDNERLKQSEINLNKNQDNTTSNLSSQSDNNKPEGAILKDFLVAMSGKISYNGYGDGENYLSGFTRNGICYTRFNGVRGEGGYQITRVNGNLTLKVVTSSNTFEFTAYKNLYEKWEFSLSNIENGDDNLRGTTWQNQ